MEKAKIRPVLFFPPQTFFSFFFIQGRQDFFQLSFCEPIKSLPGFSTFVMPTLFFYYTLWKKKQEVNESDHTIN